MTVLEPGTVRRRGGSEEALFSTGMLLAPSATRVMREAAPGRFARGRRFVIGYPTKALQILVGWGVVTVREGEELAEVLRAQHRRIPRHASFVDLRQVVRIDGDALDVLAEAMAALVEVNTAITTRSAVVRPAGPAGMAVAGFWQLVKGGYPVRVFTDPAAALRWLGHPRKRIATDLAAWDRLRTSSDLTARLQGLLAASPSLSVAAAAHALGISSRTLQRELRRDRTTFRRESDASRIRTAQAQLGDDDLSIKQIAALAGFTSPSAFAARFRRITGRAPSAWRRGRS